MMLSVNRLYLIYVFYKMILVLEYEGVQLGMVEF